MSFAAITEKATQKLQERISDKWFNADGTPKPNWIWKISDNTPKGDGGEQIVAAIFKHLYEKLYKGYRVDVKVVGGDRGDYDVIITVAELDITIKIEVKTATESSDGQFQWNGLKPQCDFDYAFGLGVRPDSFDFAIQSRQYLKENLTTNMSKGVKGSLKWTSTKKDNVMNLTEENFIKRLEELDLA